MYTIIKRALSNPSKVPPYILGRLFPRSRWGGNQNVIKRDNFISFTHGGFVASPSNRSEFSGKLYFEARELSRLINEFLPRSSRELSLEIGCGYGRLSPWIAECVEEAHAIDPNETALSEAQTQYPHIQFESQTAQELSYPNEHIDLVVTWTVLQHIPPSSIKSVCDEINRVLSVNGIVIIAEATDNAKGPSKWGRSKDEYASLLDMNLMHAAAKPVERSFGENKVVTEHPDDTLMVFSQSEDHSPSNE